MFVQDAVAGQLMIMGSLVFGERYARLAFWFPFTFERCGGVLVNVIDTLVTTIGDGIGLSPKVYP